MPKKLDSSLRMGEENRESTRLETWEKRKATDTGQKRKRGVREMSSAYYAEWYRRNGRKRDPIKQRCHGAVAEAIKKGVIQKPTVCSMCGKKEIICGHHRDYAKPLVVIWLCYSCHKAAHGMKQMRKTKKRRYRTTKATKTLIGKLLGESASEQDYKRLREMMAEIEKEVDKDMGL